MPDRREGRPRSQGTHCKPCFCYHDGIALGRKVGGRHAVLATGPSGVRAFCAAPTHTICSFVLSL